MKNHIWFREYGQLYCLAKFSRYGMNMRIRAVCTDGEYWDVLRALDDVQERFDADTCATLDIAHPTTAKRAGQWRESIGDVR